MDAINIIVGLNLLATLGANLSGAKKGLKSTVTVPREKPDTYLQKLPLFLATAALVALILGIFQIGTIDYTDEIFMYRAAGLTFYIIFSWMQVWAYKSLGESYSQEILIYKNHKLVSKGPYRFMRHPQYVSQLFIDFGGAIAVMSYVLIIIAIIEIPFIFMRSRMEDKLLAKHFKEDYPKYKRGKIF
jgi:protein-S-isoprenylcysteine O-methyltransferase Ste14